MTLSSSQIRSVATWVGLLGAASLASGVMLVLALPLGEQGYLGWFAFVPIIRLVRFKGFFPAFGAALISIFVAAWISTTGVFYSVRDTGGSSGWVFTGFGIFGFSVCLAIGQGSKKLPVWWFAGLAVLLEAYLLTQLPTHIALTQYRNVAVLQIAAIGGIWMVSFLVWWSNFYLATLSWRGLGIAVCVIVPCSLISSRLNFRVPGQTVSVGVVQTAQLYNGFLSYMHSSVSNVDPDFVVWPELAGVPFTGSGDPRGLANFSGSNGFAPIVTSYQDGHKPLPHNTAALFSLGTVSSLYWKRKLFGSESKMHTPGDRAVAVPYRDGQLGLNICFDSCYPEIIRETANLPGVNIIALPSIDPEATNNFVAAIHASYCPFRSAENGVGLVKADGMAYSMFVDPYGQVISELPPGDHGDVETVPIHTHWTPYKQFGDWFLYLLGLVVSARLGIHIRERSRDKKLGGLVVTGNT